MPDTNYYCDGDIDTSMMMIYSGSYPIPDKFDTIYDDWYDSIHDCFLHTFAFVRDDIDLTLMMPTIVPLHLFVDDILDDYWRGVCLHFTCLATDWLLQWIHLAWWWLGNWYLILYYIDDDWWCIMYSVKWYDNVCVLSITGDCRGRRS